MRTNDQAVVEVLNDAADLLRDYGWTQGKPGNKQVGFCMLGAITHASGLDKLSVPWNTREVRKGWTLFNRNRKIFLRALAAVEQCTSSSSVVYINDNPYFTEVEAEKTLRSAIKCVGT